jgi:hypothetical protein
VPFKLVIAILLGGFLAACKTTPENNGLTKAGTQSRQYITRTDECGQPMESLRGVTSCSNGKNSYSGSSCAGEYSKGYRYQCVELIRRYIGTKWGWASAAMLSGHAKSWWAAMKNSSSYETFPNGKTNLLPQAGDIIVWTGGTWGHIALIGNVFPVGENEGTVAILQQNMKVGTEELPYKIDEQGMVSIMAGSQTGGVSSSPAGWGRIKLEMSEPDAVGHCYNGKSGTPMDMSPEDLAALEAEERSKRESGNQQIAELYSQSLANKDHKTCLEVYQKQGNAINLCESHPKYRFVNTLSSTKMADGRQVIRICGDYDYLQPNYLRPSDFQPFWLVCDAGQDVNMGSLGYHDSCPGNKGTPCPASPSAQFDAEGVTFQAAQYPGEDLPDVREFCEGYLRIFADTLIAKGIPELSLCYRSLSSGQALATNFLARCKAPVNGQDLAPDWASWHRCEDVCDDSRGMEQVHCLNPEAFQAAQENRQSDGPILIEQDSQENPAGPVPQSPGDPCLKDQGEISDPLWDCSTSARGSAGSQLWTCRQQELHICRDGQGCKKSCLCALGGTGKSDVCR